MKDEHSRGPLVSWRALPLLAALALAAGCLQLETHIQLREDGGAIVSERLRFSRVLLDLAGDREAELLRFISREGVLARMQQMGKGVALVRHEVREADGNSRESLSEFQVADINEFLYAAPWPFYLDYASNAVMRCRLEPMLRNGSSGGQDWAGSIALRFELLKPARGADDGKDPKAPAAAGPNPSELQLARELFVPITVVAYLYLGLTYGGYPYLIKLLIPAKLRALPMPVEKSRTITSNEKLIFAVIACILLSLLFPVASPLLLSLFVGVVIRESNLPNFYELFSNTVLYGSTFFLGLLLGVLCEANTILNPVVLKLLVLGILALLISGIGGILGGYAMYFWSGKKYNPVIGIAGVSCVPTTAKVAQKSVGPGVIILPHALGANISGVITSAIFAATLIAFLLPMMQRG